MSAFGPRAALSYRAAIERQADIIRAFEAAGDQPQSVEAIWLKVRRQHPKGAVKTAIGTLRARGRLETVRRGGRLVATTYRLAREAKSA